jgi:hypothetical protein
MVKIKYLVKSLAPNLWMNDIYRSILQGKIRAQLKYEHTRPPELYAPESSAATPGDSGTMYFDDIRLYRATPEPKPHS